MSTTRWRDGLYGRQHGQGEARHRLGKERPRKRRTHRDLVGTVEREKAAIGVYLTLEPATSHMKEEAVKAGFYHSDGWNKDYPRIQILTVEDILAGKTVQLPPNSKHSNKRER